jgi:hypothetical protein
MLTQRIRLEQEGVVLRRGRVVLDRFRWSGGGAPGRRGRLAESDLIGLRSGRS